MKDDVDVISLGVISCTGWKQNGGDRLFRQLLVFSVITNVGIDIPQSLCGTRRATASPGLTRRLRRHDDLDDSVFLPALNLIEIGVGMSSVDGVCIQHQHDVDESCL